MRGKSLVVADLESLVAVNRIDAKEGLPVAFNDADTKVGRRRSTDEAVRFRDPRAPDDCVDRRCVAGETLEKLGDLNALEHLGPTIEQENTIEGRAGERDADEAPRVGMPALPGPDEGEIDRLGDRRSVGGEKRRRYGKSVVGAEGQAHSRQGRADDELFPGATEHKRHASRCEGHEHRPSLGQREGGRLAADPLDQPPCRRIETNPVAEDRLELGDRPAAWRGDERPRNRKTVEGELRGESYPFPVEQCHLNGRGEWTRPEIPR
jgi:hypothetical protein